MAWTSVAWIREMLQVDALKIVCVTCMLPSTFCTMLREKLTRLTSHEKLTRCCAKNRCCKLARVRPPLSLLQLQHESAFRNMIMILCRMSLIFQQ